MYLLPDIFLQFTAEALEFPRSDMPDTIRFAGPLLPSRSGEFKEPAWWAELDGSRPVVLITQGTLANRDFNELIQPALLGLRDENVTVIAATGRSDNNTLDVPKNARVASFIPFDRVLPKADVLVTNGGYGAVNHAFSLGVPIVVAGETDNIFPIEGVQQAFATIQQIYAHAGAPENCRLVIGDGGHRFYAAQSWPIFNAFASALRTEER